MRSLSLTFVSSVLAVASGSVASAQYSASEADQELAAALLDNDVPKAKRALAQGANPNTDVNGGMPLLKVRGSRKNPKPDEMIRLLLEAGADPAKKDYAGKTVSMLALDLPDLTLARTLKARKKPWNSFINTVRANTDKKTLHTFSDFAKIVPPKLFESYVLGYDTGSLQGASDLAPRTIYFGGEDDPIVTVVGDKTLPGFLSVEMAEYNPSRDGIDFARSSLDRDEKSPITTSETNPAACANCHYEGIDSKSSVAIEERRELLRFNWDSYFSWKNFYGSVDDDFTDREKESAHTRPTEAERDALKKFLDQDLSKTRYRFLASPKKRYAMA